MSTEASLIDRLALMDVMATYARTIDEREIEDFRALFADAVEVHGFASETMYGVDEWAGFVSKALEPYTQTQHMLGPQLATVQGDSAETRTDLQAVHMLREPAGRIFTLWGTYRTQMSRVGDSWVITRHELVVRGLQTTG